MTIRYLLAFVVAALVAIPAYAKVSTDFDASANFAQYHTYAWGEGTPARNPLIAQRIVEGIEQRLAAKGLQKVDSADAADLIVVYQTATDTRTDINTYNTGRWGAVRNAVQTLHPQGYAMKSNSAPLITLDPSPDFEKVVEACGGSGGHSRERRRRAMTEIAAHDGSHRADQSDKAEAPERRLCVEFVHRGG